MTSKKVEIWELTVRSQTLPAASVLLPKICLCILTLFLATETIAQRTKDHPKPHHEDLTGLRLKFPEVEDSVIKKNDDVRIEILPATNSVSTKVNEVLDSIARFNQTKMFIDGFTIQLYSGLKKEEAMNAKKKMAEEARNLQAELIYQQPKFRVKTGSYFTRLEAQRDLHRLKRIFPNAILIPEKVALR